jgi:hypothetical protein
MKKKEQDKFVFRLIKENTDPTIQGVKFPRSYSIPCVDEIYDKETDDNRVIRYASGERNIFLDEQYDQDMSKRAQIVFFDGYLIVDKRQKLLLDYLRRCNGNESNSNRMPGKKVIFKEIKPGVGATETMKYDKLVMEAKQAAYTLNLDEMIGYARVLGFDVNRDPAEIRYAMSVFAEKNPQNFMEGLDNPTTKRKFYVYQALDAGILTIDRNSGSVKWGDSKQVIVQAPVGQNPLDYLVEFTFDAKGESVYERIRTLLTPSNEPIAKEESEEENSDLIGMSGEELVRLAKEKDVVNFKGGAVMFNDSKIGVGYSKSGDVVDENATLKRQLIKAIENA